MELVYGQRENMFQKRTMFCVEKAEHDLRCVLHDYGAATAEGDATEAEQKEALADTPAEEDLSNAQTEDSVQANSKPETREKGEHARRLKHMRCTLLIEDSC